MSTPQHGYRIDTMGGVMARWLLTVEDAKKHYLSSCLADAEDGDPPLDVRFEPSVEDEDGDPCAAYIRIVDGGRWQASISPEPPAWPAWDISRCAGRGDGPPLTMVAAAGDQSVSVSVVSGCAHAELTCSGSSRPRIACLACGQAWTPA